MLMDLELVYLIDLNKFSHIQQRNIQNMREINNQLLLTQSKSLTIKKYVGGLKKTELKIINPTSNISKLKNNYTLEDLKWE